MRLSRVLLPQPDGPTIDANSPGRELDRDTVERDEATLLE